MSHSLTSGLALCLFGPKECGAAWDASAEPVTQEALHFLAPFLRILTNNPGLACWGVKGEKDSQGLQPTDSWPSDTVQGPANFSRTIQLPSLLDPQLTTVILMVKGLEPHEQEHKCISLSLLSYGMLCCAAEHS